jgi:hypothetical protein
MVSSRNLATHSEGGNQTTSEDYNREDLVFAVVTCEVCIVAAVL